MNQRTLPTHFINSDLHHPALHFPQSTTTLAPVPIIKPTIPLAANATNNTLYVNSRPSLTSGFIPKPDKSVFLFSNTEHSNTCTTASGKDNYASASRNLRPNYNKCTISEQLFFSLALYHIYVTQEPDSIVTATTTNNIKHTRDHIIQPEE